MNDGREEAVGQPIARPEDRRLLTGAGRFTDDVRLPGEAIGHVLRADHAHGLIRGLNIAPALRVPGVIAVYTAADLAAAGIGPLRGKLALKNHDGSPIKAPPRPALAADRVRFVGEPVAFVVAESLAAARDGAERVELEIEALPVVTDATAATAAGAPRLFAEVPDNVILDWRFGDAVAIEQAFAGAAHVTRLCLVNNRVHAASMEPRAAVAAYDSATARLTLHVGCQGVFGLRQSLAGILGIAPAALQVLTGDVGGSFGMKAPAYPEYVALLHAARALGRPVRWCNDRSESFVSDHHGRDSVIAGELALDADGGFLAIRFTGSANIGAHGDGFGPAIATMNLVKNAPSLYRTPLIGVAIKAVLTNTVPVGAYRGAGRPEGNYFMERLVDAAARETGRDPVALRRHNLIAPDAMPYTAASGLEYDSGDFAAVLDTALAAADWTGFATRRQAAQGRGQLRGIGLACYLEATAPAGKEMGGIRFDADGGVTIVTGTLDYGQGHAATFAQILADRLSLPIGHIRLLQGDSDALIAGGGTGGSRSVMASGSAILAAADQVIVRGRALAGHILEAARKDIEFTDGGFRIAGTDRAIGLLELAAAVRQRAALPDGAAPNLPPDLPDSLDAALVVDTPPSSFPNGCHIAEVEIDPETGALTLAAYTVVDDFGTLVNPMLVEGQVHGGVVQGIGQAILEDAVYDGDGTLLGGSFMDYALPRAADLPALAFTSHPVPARTNRLGVKGCGEAGVTGALPAIMNAVIDALAAWGITHFDMPATPARIWAALQQRRAQTAAWVTGSPPRS